jgi:hypothetical protein
MMLDGEVARKKHGGANLEDYEVFAIHGICTIALANENLGLELKLPVVHHSTSIASK